MDNRIDYIDISKAIGIILMIMGHIGFGDVFDYFIHSFHMPLFFFLTGYLYTKKNNFLKYVLKKVKSLLVPYYLFSIVFFIIKTVIYDFSIGDLVTIFFLPTNNIPIAGALWFLMSLFFSDLIYYAINHHFNDNTVVIISLFVGVVGQVLSKRNDLTIPFGLAQAMVGVGIIQIGRLLRKREKIILDLNPLYVVVVLIVSSILSRYSGYVNMRTNEYPSILGFWIVSTLYIICVLYISNLVNKTKTLKKYFLQIGNYSIVYVVFNQFIIMMLKNIRNYYGIPKNIYRFVALPIVIITIYIFNELTKNTKFKHLIGK